ncbi:DNA-binding transcriptional regulator, MerR family [Paraoerskovia marina]|uniref:DNA-binding transcriptional regulator, MerR family n=1 Tax=Paraoerskovia marina TaxID=545619 RepID=A0A1H1PAR2_9CELL|nr:MerR family transcriptional regulator [Paraoerskovia marina]SDS08302.1 DNA-binding transcriptional regulator, MerR family [Paraoerskovia marina]
MSNRHKIGEVAERTGLSLRTIRYYEEVGLVRPTARTDGGFRLFTDDDVARLEVLKGMKPLGFSLDEMRELVDVLDGHGGADGRSSEATLAEFHARAVDRCASLRRKLASAEALTEDLGRRLEGGRG